MGNCCDFIEGDVRDLRKSYLQPNKQTIKISKFSANKVHNIFKDKSKSHYES